MKKVYNKLVRDKIPEIIAADGHHAKTRILSEADYLEALLKKLEEEVAELNEARDVEELADVQEVVLAIADALKIPHGDLAHTMSEKAAKRGSFKKRIYLEEVS